MMETIMNNITGHHFILVLSQITENTEGLEDILFEAGCDDALIFYKNNTVYLEFDRESANFENAIFSAIRAVEGTNIGIKVKRVEPDMIVNLSDIAKRTKLSRQLVSMLASGERGDGTFPPPISKITSPNPLWNWSSVAKWMFEHNKLDEKTASQAYLIEDINGALELRNQETAQRRLKLLEKLESAA